MPDDTIDAYLSNLAERTATPAGGATAALNAAQAAALLAMSARYCDGPALAEHRTMVERVISEAERLRHQCVALMVADGESYGGVMAAYRLPRTTSDERAARAVAVAAALATAAVPPAEVIGAATRLLKMAQALQPIVNRSIAPDVAAAVEAIRAAIGASRTNIEANLAGITDPTARDQLTSVVAEVPALETAATQLITTIRARYA